MNSGNGRLVAYGFACALVMVVAAPAAATWWKTPDGYWHEPGNWPRLPLADDDAYIELGTARLADGEASVRSLGVGGRFVMSGGTLLTNNPSWVALEVGGIFQQSGGLNQVTRGLSDALTLNGLYELSGSGQLEVVGMMHVGYEYAGTGYFTQTGGSVSIEAPTAANSHWATLYIGNKSNSNGHYSISGGSLSAGTLVVGEWSLSISTFSIGHSSADITFQRMILLPGARVEAVAGSRIKLLPNPSASDTSPNFLFCGSPINMAGLANITFQLDSNDSGKSIWFHVTGKDFGANESGFDYNCAVGGMEIGLERDVTLILNNRAWMWGFSNNEALYVDSIVLGEGSTLDLAGWKLYYRNFTNLGGEVLLNGGTFQQVPEPASMAMLGLGAVALLRRRRTDR